MLLRFFLYTSLIIAFHNPNSSKAAIFGENNINDTLSCDGPCPGPEQAVAIGILNTLIEPSHKKNYYTILPDSLAGFLCKNESMAQDISIPYACSGFLIAEDILVTAGHCMSNFGEVINESGAYCEVYKWVFDFQNNNSGFAETELVAAENVYSCKKILFAVKDEKAPYRDYAIVQLDRKVKNRKPLKISTKPTALNQKVKMLGFPLGTPMKLTDMAKIILNNPEREVYITNLDALDGNSGSAVLNEKNEVVGILAGGLPSRTLVSNTKNKCEMINKCDNQGKNCSYEDTDLSLFPYFQAVGSEVQRIDTVNNKLIEIINKGPTDLY